MHAHMKSRSQTKDHSHQSGSETSTHAGEMASCLYAWLAWSFPPTALGKAYEDHVGKALPTCSCNRQQPQSVVNGFVEQSGFEAMKMLSGWEAAHCDEHSFRAKSK